MKTSITIEIKDCADLKAEPLWRDMGVERAHGATGLMAHFDIWSTTAEEAERAFDHVTGGKVKLQGRGDYAGAFGWIEGATYEVSVRQFFGTGA